MTARAEAVIPVFNEEGIIELQLRKVLEEPPFPVLVTVVENGSTDGTAGILDRLAAEFANLHVIRLPEPNYGLAMREGLLASRLGIVLIDDADVLDTDFWSRGLALLDRDGVDIVQGSKVLAGRQDGRPLVRRLATLGLTLLLKILFRYPGTDTHGPKVMRMEKVRPVIGMCGLELDIFPTELVIRSQRAGLVVKEIPIHIREMRRTPFPLRKRVRRAIRDLLRLRKALGPDDA